MSLPQVNIQHLPVTIVVHVCPSEVLECSCCLEGVQVDPDFHPVCLKSPSAVSLAVDGVPLPARTLQICDGDYLVPMEGPVGHSVQNMETKSGALLG